MARTVNCTGSAVPAILEVVRTLAIVVLVERSIMAMFGVTDTSVESEVLDASVAEPP